MTRLATGVAIALAAAALLLPSLIAGVNGTDSAHLNDVWARQFAELMANGDPYPRWLPGSFGGLGSPAFIFYPPLAFWVDGLVRLLVGGAMPVPHRLAITAWLLLWASGAAMHAWLRSQIRPGLALLGALLYMAAPYHLMDHYWRGALAEFAAYAAVPLVLLGVRASALSWRGLAVLGVGYALLLLAHLPTALLVTLFLLPAFAPWTAYHAPRPAAALDRCMLGGVLGLALAGLYLLPATALLGYVSHQVFWQDPFYDPNRWVLLVHLYLPVPVSMWIILSVASCYLALSLALGDRLWSGMAAFSLMALAGAIPLLWSIPLLATVQFPFRLLTVVEASLVTGAMLALDRRAPWGRGWLMAAAVALVPGLWLFGSISAGNVRDASRYWARLTPVIEAHMMDGPEYLPAGFPADKMDSVAGPGPWTAPDGLSTDCPGATCTAARRGAAIEVSVSGAAPVTLAQFAFPGWAASVDGAALPLGESGDWHFLTFETPPGPHVVVLRRVWTPAEKAGAGLSLTALGAVIVCWLAPRRGKPAG